MALNSECNDADYQAFDMFLKLVLTHTHTHPDDPDTPTNHAATEVEISPLLSFSAKICVYFSALSYF